MLTYADLDDMIRLATQVISSVALFVILVQRFQMGHGLILASPVSAAPVSRVAAFGTPLFPLHSCLRSKRSCRRDGVGSLCADLIKDICAREIIDSRGNPTVEVKRVSFCNFFFVRPCYQQKSGFVLFVT
jgi:hypothetical protein